MPNIFFLFFFCTAFHSHISRLIQKTRTLTTCLQCIRCYIQPEFELSFQNPSILCCITGVATFSRIIFNPSRTKTSLGGGSPRAASPPSYPIAEHSLANVCSIRDSPSGPHAAKFVQRGQLQGERVSRLGDRGPFAMEEAEMRSG